MRGSSDEYYDSDEFKELLRSYEDMVESGDMQYMDADDLTIIAEYYSSIDEMDKAYAAVDYALSISPDASSPIEFKALEAIHDDDFDTARAYIDQLKDTSDPEYQYLRIEYYLAQHKLAEAKRLVDEYYKEIDDEEEQSEYCFDIANLYCEYFEYKTASGWFDMAEKSDDEQYLELKSHIAYGLGHYDMSIGILQELIDRKPFSVKYWNVLTKVYIALDNYGEALTCSDYAYAINPNDPNAVYTRANVLMNLDNYEKAIVLFKKYLNEIDDQDFDSAFQITNCYMAMNQYPAEAFKYARMAIDLAFPISSELSDAYKAAIVLSTAAGDFDEAMRLTEEARRTDVLDFEYHLMKGHIHLCQERIAEADSDFQKALTESHDLARTTMQIVVSMHDNGMERGAYHLTKNLLKKDNGTEKYGFAYAFMTLVCHDMDRKDETLKYLKIALKRAPSQTKALLKNIIPADVSIDHYYEYMYNKLNKRNK